MHRTLLITTCENEALMAKQRESHADVVFLELEDGVSLPGKDVARQRAVTALKEWDYGTKERWVRINSVLTLDGMKDVLALAEGRPDALIPAKVRSADELIATDYLLTRREEELGLPIGGIKLCPMIESAPALFNLRELIQSSPRVKGLLLGAADLSVDMGLVRTEEEHELDYVRGHLVLTAHAMGVECFDVTSTLINEPETVYREAKRACEHGFDGKACISPSQVEAVHRGFAPDALEVEWAARILEGEREADARGVAVYAVDGHMVDMPIILAARRIMERSLVNS
ncbi:MAG TPA: CoA ester lyase [Acidimicrobiales bacterium]|jgi:citrate lyase beta subunit|nr:CoA ester lyase [Acidimicrobiales bacterium]